MENKTSKRTLKNIIMILMIIALGAGAYFTMDYASEKSVPSSISSSMPGDFNGAPPSGDFGNSQSGEMPDFGSQPPEMPGGDNSDSSNQPPEMPSGDNSNSSNQPPEMPGGEKPDGMPSEVKGDFKNGRKTSTVFYVIFAAESVLIALILIYLIMSGFNKKGFNETLKGGKRVAIYALSVIVVASCLTVIEGEVSQRFFNSNPMSQGQMMPGNKGGSDSQTSVDATGATTVDGESQNLTDSFTSTSSDESAILVTNGGNATVNGAKITKSGDSTNTENSEFYGVNAAVLVQSGSTATIKGADITTDATGANAVFSTGEDAKIYISDSTITTTGESSARGLDSTYCGYIEADNVTVKTSGGSCASLATDRGEGTVIARNSTLETNGKGSPVIYSTGDITVENTTGTANGSQMVVVEGKNSATVKNSTLKASAAGNRGDADVAGIMLYQSMSGDASEGTATLTATDSTLEIQSNSDYYKSAPMFFITNTDAVINLKNTKLVFGSNILLNAAATTEWGNEGSNGGNVTLNAENQTLKGDITADSISTVAISLTSSNYEGAINADNSAKEVTLKLDKNSKIKLTGDSYVTSLDDADSTYSNIDFNGFTLYVNGKAVNS